MNPFKSLLEKWKQNRRNREQAALVMLKARYHAFRIFLENNGKALELIVSLDGQLHRAEAADIRATVDELLGVSSELVDGLNLLSHGRYESLYAINGNLGELIYRELRSLGQMTLTRKACVSLDQLDPKSLMQAGAKAVNLARLKQMGLPVPNGFACTVRACKKFLHSSELSEKIRPLLRDVEIGRLPTEEAAETITALIFNTPLPPDVTTALFQAYEDLASQEQSEGRTFEQPLAVSVRSSGAAEDGVEHSFAGQFTSLLNVRGQESLLDACRQVIASGFSARAIAYRMNAGLAPFDFDLAVLVQVMVPAEAAGVLFTVDPSRPESGRMLISAVPGLGTTAVGGEVPADLYRPLRFLSDEDAVPLGDLLETETPLSHQVIAQKTHREVPDKKGGLKLEAVPESEGKEALLNVEMLTHLVRFGRTIESVEGIAQDIEWALADGQLFILQARPLRVASSGGQRPHLPTLSEPLCTGFCASAGKAVGRVRLIHSIFELQQLEAEDAAWFAEAPLILALPHSIVDAARFLPRCAGLVVDLGNPTDHLACVARECGVPMITGAQKSLEQLRTEQWVLIDADHGLVLDVPDAVREQAIKAHQQDRAATGEAKKNSASPASMSLSPVRQTLRDRIVALNLTDAYGPTFSLAECRSIHDIIRYTHEMAVLTMFSAGDQVMEDAGGLLRPMDIGIPFTFLVVDLGGGIRRQNPQKRRRLRLRRILKREDVLSVPLAALCDGMTTPGLRWVAPADVDVLPSVMSRTMLDSRGPRPAGTFNYALTARDYLNLNARVEFHFAMVDAVCGRDSHANYIRFRLKGGGAGHERSHRRALFFQHVLEHNSFYTTVVGDLVTASLVGAEKKRIQEQLIMIGRLFGFSRFLDGMMKNDEIPIALANAFLQGEFDSLRAMRQIEAKGCLE